MNVGQWRSIENLSKCEKKRKIGERKKNNFFFLLSKVRYVRRYPARRTNV